jgi:hypothetical protein
MPSELAEITARWESLPTEIQEQVLALIRQAE